MGNILIELLHTELERCVMSVNLHTQVWWNTSRNSVGIIFIIMILVYAQLYL